MFCQLEVLRHSFPSIVPRILEELPESLGETYERILKEISKLNQGHAHRLLQCLVAAVRPLEVKDLAESSHLISIRRDSEAQSTLVLRGSRKGSDVGMLNWS